MFLTGSEESLISLSGLDISQDIHGALSLLSTDSPDSCKQSKHVHHDTNNTSIPKPWNYGVPYTLGLPLGSTEHWNIEQSPGNFLRHNLTPQGSGNSNYLGSIQFPECLMEGQHEFGFESALLS